MPPDDDPFDLARFVAAQATVIDRVLAELRAGRKRTHWMWFVFPQAEGLGSSPMAQKYAIRSPAEARAFLAHPKLGERLRDCVGLVVAARRPLAAIFDFPDDLKFCSCVTLFAAIAPQEAIFAEALAILCRNGEADSATAAWLERFPLERNRSSDQNSLQIESVATRAVSAAPGACECSHNVLAPGRRGR